MKEKNKKRLPWIVAGILLIIIIYLLMRPMTTPTSIIGGSTNYGSSGGNGFYDGSCSDGGKYHCTMTCTNTPPTTIPRPTGTSTPTDSISCRDYAKSLGYSYSVWDVTIIGTRQCEDYAKSTWCSIPKSTNLVQYCCMANC